MTIFGLYALLSLSVEHKSSISRFSLVILLVSMVTLMFMTLFLGLIKCSHDSVNSFNCSIKINKTIDHMAIKNKSSNYTDQLISLVAHKLSFLNNYLVFFQIQTFIFNFYFLNFKYINLIFGIVIGLYTYGWVNNEEKESYYI